MAFPPNSPGYQASNMASEYSSAGVITNGRPCINTVAARHPDARTACNSLTSRSFIFKFCRSFPSPTRFIDSPTTTIVISDVRAEAITRLYKASADIVRPTSLHSIEVHALSSISAYSTCIGSICPACKRIRYVPLFLPLSH